MRESDKAQSEDGAEKHTGCVRECEEKRLNVQCRRDKREKIRASGGRGNVIENGAEKERE